MKLPGASMIGLCCGGRGSLLSCYPGLVDLYPRAITRGLDVHWHRVDCRPHCAAREAPHELWRCEYETEEHRACAIGDLQDHRHGSYPPACVKDKTRQTDAQLAGAGFSVSFWRPIRGVVQSIRLQRTVGWAQQPEAAWECPWDYKCVDALPYRTPETRPRAMWLSSPSMPLRVVRRPDPRRRVAAKKGGPP